MKKKIFMENIKIKYKFILFFSMVIFIFIGFTSYFLYKKNAGFLYEKAANTYLQHTIQSNDNISFLLNSYERILNYFYLNEDFKMILSSESYDVSDYLTAKKKILNYISSLTIAYDLIPSIKIYIHSNDFLIDNDLFFDIDRYKETDWAYEVSNAPAKMKLHKWLKPYKDVKSGMEQYIMGGIVTLEDDRFQTIAMIFMELDLLKMFEFLDKNGKDSTDLVETVLINDEGFVIYSTDNDMITKNIGDKPFIKRILPDAKGYFNTRLENKNKLVVFDTNKKTGWKLLSIIDDRQIVGENRSNLRFTILLSFSGIVFAMIVTFFYVNMITKRIQELTNAMITVGEGNFDVNTSISGMDEIGKMNSVFLNMLRETKKLVNDIRETENSKHKLELMSMQEQIKPHFLYNSLSAISSIALTIEAYDIYAAIQSLTQYYKVSLSKGMNIILISDEIKHVQSYVNLLVLRFRNKLNIVYDIDDNVYPFYTPKILLQPLVENSVLHGFNTKREKIGTVMVRVAKKDNSILFEVEDDGVGIREEVIENIVNGSSGGYALKNIDNRVKLVCGPEYGLGISSIPGKGTRVTIKISLLRMEDTQAP